MNKENLGGPICQQVGEMGDFKKLGEGDPSNEGDDFEMGGRGRGG